MIISVMSRKGGCGKSTLSMNLAAFLASNAGVKVALMDADPQGSSTEWIRVRQEKAIEPKISHLSLGDFDSIPDYDYVVIDGQGSDGDYNRRSMLLSDLIVVPLKPSQPDLDTIPYMSSLIDYVLTKNKSVNVKWVINEAPTNTRLEVKQALEYYKAFKLNPVDTVIHCRKAYRDAPSFGLGITEYKQDSKAKAEFLSLVYDLIENTKVREFLS